MIFAFLGGVFLCLVLSWPVGAQAERRSQAGSTVSCRIVTMVAIFGSAYLFAWFSGKTGFEKAQGTELRAKG